MRPVKPYVKQKLDPSTLDIGILAMMELEPPLIVNGEAKVIDVEAPIPDVPSGEIPLRLYLNKEKES